MNSEIPNRDESVESVDRAISARLAKLRSMPVDLTNLEKAIKAQILPPTNQSRWRALTLRPLRAIAASVVLVSAIAAAILLSASSGPVLAEAAQMAQVHREIVSGKIHVTQVSSINAANHMLDQEAPGAPSLPQLPDSHVMACCMKSVHNKKMACVLLRDEGVSVTLAVASAADMKLPTAPVQSRNGVEYRVQHIGDLSMVMTERNGKWLCLIGPMPADRLMDMAAQLQF
jgi:anti-sigma factor RsiW